MKLRLLQQGFVQRLFVEGRIGNAGVDLLDIEEIRRINENTLSESCSKEKIREIKEIMDRPDLCPHEDYSKEAKRFFGQKKGKTLLVPRKLLQRFFYCFSCSLIG